MNLLVYLLGLCIFWVNNVNSKLLPNSVKYPLANLTMPPPTPHHPGFARIGLPIHSHLLSTNSPMTLFPSPISANIPATGSPSPDLYWIPNLGHDILPGSHRERGFFGKIRSFFTEMRIDPSRAFVRSFDLFLGRLGEAIFHALVEISLDFILGFGRG